MAKISSRRLLLLMIILLSFWIIYRKLTEPKWIRQFDAGNLTKNPRVILVWNDLWHFKNWNFNLEPGIDFLAKRCPVSNCVVTDRRSMLRYADAVMFHLFDPTSPPPFKPDHQRWVLFSHEPPQNVASFKLKEWENMFNWTMTYRLDSDIYMPYSNFSKRTKPLNIDYQDILRKKRKLVAWMVSNCDAPSKRKEYVRELQKHVPVDVYGKCSSEFGQEKHCGKKDGACNDMLNDTYKFYLGFENCLTKDYTTEKYFNMVKFNLVPVVRGDGNYSVVGPVNSYIDTRDFESPEKLADYLKYLDGNDKEYIKYLKWKEMFIPGSPEYSFCELCKRINDPNEPHKFYEDIYKWYGTCRTPNDFK